MNRINKLFENRKKKILSVYFTAGFPELNDTLGIISELDKSGVDMLEIGMPFSDPVADGPVIQRSSEIALKNGMTINLLFEQLAKVREITDMPLILMGYINPVFKYGMENFLKKCNETGIDGTIIPDLPPDEYLGSYESLYMSSGIYNIFLISPQSSAERIRYLDSISKGFLYIVSTSSTTGIKNGIDKSQIEYFEKVKGMNLRSPLLTGFGISDRSSFQRACEYSNGAIVGSAFIKAIDKKGSPQEKVKDFVSSYR